MFQKGYFLLWLDDSYILLGTECRVYNTWEDDNDKTQYWLKHFYFQNTGNLYLSGTWRAQILEFERYEILKMFFTNF